MRALGIVFWFATLFSHPLISNDSLSVSDYKIAVAVREAVRMADSTLLNTTTLGPWREHLKVAATSLELPVQPLVLIKFDEDARFRNQLKTIIAWEREWLKSETEHFIYYYRWDQPPPEIILHIQDAHFNELAKLFEIEVEEKIPFRYDLEASNNDVYPYEDLRGGIVSHQPFDLYLGALAIFKLINSEPDCFLEPLARIYGTYFQNPSTSKAYYDVCMKKVAQEGYVSAAILVGKENKQQLSPIEEQSAFLFVFDLDREFGAQKISQFLSHLGNDLSVHGFESSFQESFEISLSAFEGKYRSSAQK